MLIVSVFLKVSRLICTCQIFICWLDVSCYVNMYKDEYLLCRVITFYKYIKNNTYNDLAYAYTRLHFFLVIFFKYSDFSC